MSSVVLALVRKLKLKFKQGFCTGWQYNIQNDNDWKSNYKSI